MIELARQKCFLHWQREAVARCPDCLRYFCRECVTEHEGRVICASCLHKRLPRPSGKRPAFRLLAQAVQCFLGLIILWLFFYYLGQILLSIPTSFHDGTLWTQSIFGF